MDWTLLESIRRQVEPGITISFHRDGDPLAYSRLGDALRLFKGFTISLVTHGLNLSKRADELIENCTCINISVFRGDPDHAAQLASLRSFLAHKGDRAPQVQVKIVGDMDADGMDEYAALGVRVIRRLIHVPIGNSKYAHRSPTIPEVGICLDALHRPTIAWDGRMYLCNRLDPKGDLYIGDVRQHSVEEIWDGPIRTRMLEAHRQGRRDLANPVCGSCAFWGVQSA